MISFLEETLKTLQEKHNSLSSLKIILPSKRAGGFLVNYLKKASAKTAFAPTIISIEEFIEELSGLRIINPTELVFKSYQAYIQTPSKQEKESFDKYSTWAQTLLNDFNEIDRYLIPPKAFFNYLKSIQDLNHWYVKDEKTSLIENYLAFWDSLFNFYQNLHTLLQSDNEGYQGLVYREAAENIEHYINSHTNQKHVFIGFNALNTAEQTIFQELLETGNTEIYWDIDSYFYEDTQHSASYFIRKYFSEWKALKNTNPTTLTNNYIQNKRIKIVEAQKNIVQTKYIGEQLAGLTVEEQSQTAIVLADENLLLPILQSLPTTIEQVNITMGVSLKSFPMVSFFKQLLQLHLTSPKEYYYKHILNLINHPIGLLLFPNGRSISKSISNKNSTHLDYPKIVAEAKDDSATALEFVFKSWENKSTHAIKACLHLLLELKSNSALTRIDRIVAYELFQLFKKIEALNASFSYLESVKTIDVLFSELVAITQLDMQGDAYNGLQIMGVLESRVLDFKNVIIASVNEGILPSGKSNASFITNDLKYQFGLPTYLEKDAIYTYHFYRLLQRAQNCSILYTNNSDGLNSGEKSRFISQLEINPAPNHVIEKEVINPSIKISNSEPQTIHKNDNLIQSIKELAENGFSPSALNSYIRNPLTFYYQKILKINEFKEVEETVAANTMGTIVHNTLEEFYKPLEGTYLSVDILKNLHDKVEEEVEKQFSSVYKEGDINKGKNLLIFEVSKRFVHNFLNLEIEDLKKGNEIKIIGVENKLTVDLHYEELNFPIRLKGTVDRIDEFNKELRIIDYKTGQVKKANLNIVEWDQLIEDDKHAKVFQVLAYAFMYHDAYPFKSAEAGIISFKNLKEGFLNYAQKESQNSRKRNTNIDQEVLANFSLQLKKLILEICDPNIPFIEK